jgi:hypothetical protein
MRIALALRFGDRSGAPVRIDFHGPRASHILDRSQAGTVSADGWGRPVKIFVALFRRRIFTAHDQRVSIAPHRQRKVTPGTAARSQTLERGAQRVPCGLAD